MPLFLLVRDASHVRGRKAKPLDLIKPKNKLLGMFQYQQQHTKKKNMIEKKF